MSVDRIDASAFHEQGRAVPSDADEALRFVSVGRPYDGTRVSVRDANGGHLPERHVGEIWVTGPSVMAGYLNDAEATSRVIWGGALRTGDLGYVAGGELYIAGRKKHMLIVRGRNYYAEAIEGVVERVDGVRRGNAVAFGAYDERRATDLLHIVVETRLRGGEARAALERAIAETVSDEVGLVPASVTLLAPNSLPKTSSGKKQRLECKEMVLSGKTPGRIHRARAQVAGVVTLLRGSLATAEEKRKRALRRAG
jgi:acyl-CoA synthetase (AMP-forming)/AMP-acid ligase II